MIHESEKINNLEIPKGNLTFDDIYSKEYFLQKNTKRI